jgi:hypothetical protein
MYLVHSCPDISFATQQCAQYTHSPKQSHEDVLKKTGHYLKGMLNKGPVLTPSRSLKIHCYPDADFAGLWTRDDKQDPHCVQSCMGYVICPADFPILWKSKLQTEIALSTMEEKYEALSMYCQDLFTIIDVTKELCSLFNLDMQASADLHIKIHKENVGALVLGKLEPRQMAPCSKHYAIEYH